MNIQSLTLKMFKSVNCFLVVGISTLLLSSCAQTVNNAQVKTALSSQCSVISVLGTPKAGQELYPVILNKIDGKGISRSQKRVKVTSGEHKISVYGNFSRGLETVRNKGPHKAKVLDVTLKPNRIYYVKAQFLNETRQQTYNSKHWQPVIWKSAPMEVSCG